MRVLSAGLLLLMSVTAAVAKPVYKGNCEGSFRGVPLGGQLTVNYWPRSETHAYHGIFFDGARNRYDFEVITNKSSGVGGAWKNGMRDRESRIKFQMSGKTFTIADTDRGGSGRFICQ